MLEIRRRDADGNPQIGDAIGEHKFLPPSKQEHTGSKARPEPYRARTRSQGICRPVFVRRMLTHMQSTIMDGRPAPAGKAPLLGSSQTTQIEQPDSFLPFSMTTFSPVAATHKATSQTNTLPHLIHEWRLFRFYYDKQRSFALSKSLVDLFGPCSPVQRCLAPIFFASLVADHTPIRDSLPHNEKYVVVDACEVRQATIMDCEPPTINEALPELSTTEHMVTSLDLPMGGMTLRVGTSVEEVVMVEDASEDEEADPAMHMTVENPIDLIVVVDGSIQSTLEVRVEPLDDVPMEVAFPMEVNSMMIEELQTVTHTEDDVLVEDACIR
ncbi:hypothetical protein BAE44_0007764 [Dichanthelium oligosanthes]|uniref:Uncharacterized protein n=1 Tax=Dichanthelium oligosanthes TaxID=888268 RepID=A0A1E5W1D7_9POAL|nr:hypothetical protein BAE44_0007764 [Dichanthelium oligosanthes]